MRESLAALEELAAAAIRAGDTSELDIIGYGEISTVLRLRTGEGEFAAKRLPPFPSEALADYASVFDRYLETLRDLGTTPVESSLESFDVGGDKTVYCIQPLQTSLLVDSLHEVSDDKMSDYATRLTEMISRTVSDRVGLDAQISNWAIDANDEFLYLDVTTPLIRDSAGNELLDTDLFIASLPAALRPVVRRFLLDEILSHYYDTRAVLLDLIGNLEKERLSRAVPAFLEAANRVVEPPITQDEVFKYYRSDARMWELLQRLRQMDRWWQRSVRRRDYAFILPGKVER